MSTKISQLPAATGISGTEIVPSVQSGGNVSISINQIAGLVTANLPATLGTLGVYQTASTVTAATASLSNDPSKFYLMNSASAQTFTIPAGMTSWNVGSVATLVQVGAGAVTIAAGSGATISKASSITSLVSKGQYTVIQLVNVGTDKWIVIGGLGG